MSIKTQNRTINLTANEVFFKNDDKTKFSIFDSLNVNNLNSFYNKDDSQFKKKIDKLNFRFYLETDKFINFKHDVEKSQDNLFLLLFKQVSVYVEEIERLNLKLKEKEDNDKYCKIKLEDISKRELQDKEIIYYKATIRNLEKKNNDSKGNEDKLKKENESYRRQVVFYKDKLKMELSASGKKESFNSVLNFNLVTPGQNPTINTKKAISSAKSKNESSHRLDFTKEDGNSVNMGTNFNKNDNYFSIVSINDENKNLIANPIENDSNNNEKDPKQLEKEKNIKSPKPNRIKISRLPSMEKNNLRINEENILVSPQIKRRRNISAYVGNTNNFEKKKFTTSSINISKEKVLSLSSNKNKFDKITGSINKNKNNYSCSSTTGISASTNNNTNTNSNLIYKNKNNFIKPKSQSDKYQNLFSFDNMISHSENKRYIKNESKNYLTFLENCLANATVNRKELTNTIANTNFESEIYNKEKASGQELNELTDVFYQNLDDELELLNNEEEALNLLKINLLNLNKDFANENENEVDFKISMFKEEIFVKDKLFSEMKTHSRKNSSFNEKNNSNKNLNCEINLIDNNNKNNNEDEQKIKHSKTKSNSISSNSIKKGLNQKNSLNSNIITKVDLNQSITNSKTSLNKSNNKFFDLNKK